MSDIPLPYELLDPDRFGKLPAAPPVVVPEAPDARAESGRAMQATWDLIQADWRKRYA